LADFLRGGLRLTIAGERCLKRFLRLSAVEEITGLKKSAIYQRISCGQISKTRTVG
jgi:predicted DNA-binding transcriptional regulator AlpA